MLYSWRLVFLTSNGIVEGQNPGGGTAVVATNTNANYTTYVMHRYSSSGSYSYFSFGSDPIYSAIGTKNKLVFDIDQNWDLGLLHRILDFNKTEAQLETRSNIETFI